MSQKRVLVLTSWYFPYQVIGWMDAITNVYKGTHEVIAEYDEEVRSPSVTWKVPAVIRIKRQMKKFKKGVRFSRINVYARDHFSCQYCGRKASMRQLTYDHVIPRARGGQTTWTNIVTACKTCNMRKGQMTCDEAGMFPITVPHKPANLPLISPIRFITNPPDEWEPFLAESGK